MNKGLRTGIGTGLIAAAAFGAVLAALSFVLPASAYKERIEQSVERATGRKLTLAGPLGFTLFPQFGIRADRVSLANVAGGRAPAFVTAEHLEIGVRLLPLLGGRIEVTEIVLDRPVVHLEVDAAGHSNWLLRRVVRPGNTGGSGGGMHLPQTAQFSGIRITGGRIAYDNARTRTSRAIEGLDTIVDMTDLDRPAHAAGSFALSGQQMQFGVALTTPRAVLDDKPVGVDLTLASDSMKAHLTGRVDRTGTFAGHAKIDAPSLHRAAALFGTRLPDGFGTFSLDGALEARDDAARLSDLKLKLDTMSASGFVELKRVQGHSVFQADLAADRLDADRYLESGHGTSGGTHPGNNTEEWNRTPLALAPLRDLDLHVHIDAGTLTYRRIRMAKTSLHLDAVRGFVTADVEHAQMYGGVGTVGVTLDLHRSAPLWGLNAGFYDVALGPFLSDTIGVTQIEGTGTIRLVVTSQGSSAEAIMRGLAGKGAFDFRNGRIKGVDLDQVARTIQAFLGAAIGKGAFTDYDAMTARFTAKDGMLTSKDFQLGGPLIKTSGAGDVDVGNRTIDFRIVPKTSATLGRIKLVDIGVPFRIKGPWRHVHYTPDVGGIVSGILNAPLDRLLGDPKKKHKTVGDALKNMLGIH